MAKSVKDTVLQVLEANRGQAISGQNLASSLGVSRVAVWKAVEGLRQAGHKIEATTNKGYMLAEDEDGLATAAIKAHLPQRYQHLDIYVHKSVSSTNIEAKKLAVDGAGAGCAVLAESQSAGRGRLGKSFFSPQSSGLYISIILRPQKMLSDALLFTVAAAVATAQAIEAVSDSKAQIKWVNDVFVEGRKVCGILTEAVSDFESGSIDCMVVGIGINVNTRPEQFPSEMQELAGSINARHGSRNRLAAQLITRLLDLTDPMDRHGLLQEYRQRSFIIGQKITFNYQGKPQSGLALAINDAGHLLVANEDGQEIELQSGEVNTLRIQD